MVGSMACVAAMALGIDVGWRPLSEGGVEYLIQIEPDLLETLQPGEAIGSDVPPHLVGQIRAYRITVGTEELPRELPEELPTAAGETALGEPGGAGLQPRSWSDTSPPHRLPDVSARKPIKAEQAVFQVPEDEASPPAPEKAEQEEVAGAEKPKPWMPLLATLFGLFASLGANVFLGWMAVDFRSRYQGLVRRASEGSL